MKQADRIQVYHEFTDDFVQSRDQGCRIPKDYVWVREDIPGRILAVLIYAAAWLFSLFYCRLWLGVRIKNRSVLKKYRKQGYFLYGNHTQPLGDAFIPAQVCGTKHIYTVAGAANLGIPVLGKLLPLMGALPVPEDFTGMKHFLKAIEQRIDQKKCVVIFPEAHVWPWYTGVRPFPETSFRFPLDLQAPSFCMTVTYQKRKFVKKPRITVYLDGPFFPDLTLARKARQKKLCEQIHSCMEKRAENSTYAYIRYIKETVPDHHSK